MASERQGSPLPFSVTTSVTEESVRASAKRIAGQIHQTPVMTSSKLDQKTRGRKVFFKCEHLQKTGSFKVRGARSALTKLLETGIDPSDVNLVTYSSGNFAAGLTVAAGSTGIKNCTILMSRDCSPLKKTLVESLGAKVQLFTGDQERVAKPRSAVEAGALYISSGQTYDVISGQGTVGLEFLSQVPELDAIVVPVGGGGLISGIATIAKAIKPNILIIGAEPSLSNSCELSLRNGNLCQLNHVEKANSTVADGLRVSIGSNTWPIIKEYVDDVISVSEDEIKNATLLVWHYLKQCVEPCAGVPLAAIFSEKFASLPAEVINVGVILSGGNISQECMRIFLQDNEN
ncbi:serine racemase-like isoform X2 [Strongylocentrotus purpuratus]|nr:serine racemase-like isoform X2 [Strongylocentrotus purpuratus]